MSIEPNNEPIFVDVNTDNLDDFSKLVSGRAQEKTAEDVKEEKVLTTPAVDADIDDDDNDTSNDVVDDGDNEDDSDGEKPEAKTEPKPKKVKRYQERINALTAQAREAERALTALREAQAKQTESAPTESNTRTTQAVSKEPKPTDVHPDGTDKYPLGEFDPEYLRDFNRAIIEEEWTARKNKDAQEVAQRQEQEARNQIQNQWAEKLAPMTEQHDDFIEKTLGLENTFDGLDSKYSDFLVQTIKSLDHGPEVLYYLANNIPEADKFVKSGPLGAALALGELNAMFKGQTRKPQDATKVSKAPPPPQTNKGSSSRTAVADDTDDLDAFTAKLYSKKRK